MKAIKHVIIDRLTGLVFDEDNMDLHIEKKTLYELKCKIRVIEFKVHEVIQQSHDLLNKLFENVEPNINSSQNLEYQQLKLKLEELADKLRSQIIANNIIIELYIKTNTEILKK